jgi:hypothetical protein
MAVHDSAEWIDGVPRWMADLTKRKGSSSLRRPTPVFSGLGLNKDHLAEGGVAEGGVAEGGVSSLIT